MNRKQRQMLRRDLRRKYGRLDIVKHEPTGKPVLVGRPTDPEALKAYLSALSALDPRKPRPAGLQAHCKHDVLGYLSPPVPHPQHAGKTVQFIVDGDGVILDQIHEGDSFFAKG